MITHISLRPSLLAKLRHWIGPQLLPRQNQATIDILARNPEYNQDIGPPVVDRTLGVGRVHSSGEEAPVGKPPRLKSGACPTGLRSSFRFCRGCLEFCQKAD